MINNTGSGREVTEVRVADASGKVLRNIPVLGNRPLSVDVSYLDRGMYFLMLFDRERMISVKKLSKH